MISRRPLVALALFVALGPAAAGAQVLTKTVSDADGDGRFEPGDVVDYTIRAANATAADVTAALVDDLPAFLDVLEVVAPSGEDRSDLAARRVEIAGLVVPAMGEAEVTVVARIHDTAALLRDGVPAGGLNGFAVDNQAFLDLAPSDDPATPAAGDATRFVLYAAVDITGAGHSKVGVDEDGGDLEPGDRVRYTLRVENDGAEAAEVMVTDVLPAGTAECAVESAHPTMMCAGGRLTGRLPVPAGGSDEVVFSVAVAPGTAAGTTIRNTANLRAVTDPAQRRDVSSAALVVVVPPPFAGATKAVAGDLTPGGVVTYTLRVAGGVPVTVEDALPDGLTLVETQPPAEVEGGVLIWSLMTPAGEVAELTVVATIAADAADGTVITNQATVSAAGLPDVVTDDPATPAPADATAFTVRAGARLLGAKALAEERVGPGDPVTYTLTIRNAGDAPSAAVEVVDPIDAALVGATAEDGQIVDGEARWLIPPIAPDGEVALVLRARVAEGTAAGREVVNQFGFRPRGEERFDLSNEVTFRVAEHPLRRSAKAVAAATPEGLTPGATVAYEVRVTNDDDDPVQDVVVVDPIDTVHLDQIRPQLGGVFDPDAGTITWNRKLTPSLASVGRGNVTLSFTARIRPEVPPGTRIANQASVRAGGGAAVLTDDESTAAVDDPTVFVVEGGEGAALQVEKVVLDPALDAIGPGSLVTYNVLITNRGAGPTLDLRVEDTFPPEVEYVSGSTRIDGLAAPDITNVLLLSQALDPGATVQVSFVVRVGPDVPVGQLVLNQATVTEEGGAPVLSDDPLTAQAGDPTTFVVGGTPELTTFLKRARVLEDADNTGRALVGQTIEWTLTVTNQSPTDARRVTLSDPLPARTSYVRDSLVIDGARATDADDGDPGVFLGDSAEFDLDTVAGRTTREVRFRTRVEAGPRVQNQARLRSPSVPEELSDADANDANGDAPTVVPVGAEPQRRLSVTKAVTDPTGPPALVGEPLRYTVTARNEGTVALDGVEITDALPEGFELLDVAGAPAGASVDTAGGVLRVAGFGLQAGAEVTLVLEGRVDPRLREERQVCNVARVEAAGVGAAESAPACVDTAVRFGTLAGSVFQDLDGSGAFEASADVAFGGMRVAAYDAADPGGAPVAEATTDEAGAWQMRELRAGTFRVRVFSATGVMLAVEDGVSVAANGSSSLDVRLQPNGRVYDSREGALIDGARVFLYRDEDTDDDPFDAESQARRLLVPGTDLEAASQQGQRTAHGGLYRFGVLRPGRYLLEVVPPGSSYVSPSVLVPPAPRTVLQGEVSLAAPEPLPPSGDDADRSWYAAFEVTEAGQTLANNHLPLDPLSSLLDLSKRSLRPEAAVGDVVTYELDLTNRSPDDLLFDARTQSGGLFLQDVIPTGFKYVAGSAVLVRVDGQREVPLSADDPTGARLLRFGRIVQEGGRNVLRPFDLRAGETLRLRYQLVVGADARPRRTYTNRAVLLADGNVPVTATASADVKVVADPVFDQGLLIGKVFCDADRDGEQGEGEGGLPGARVYMDHGWYAVTDAAGKFHFRDIDPGSHAVKIDADTLLPGAELTTDETRVIHFTRGLPAKVSFGVTCPSQTADDPVLELSGGGLKAALKALRERYVVVTGNVLALRARVGDAEVAAEAPSARLLVDEGPADAPDLKPAGAGAAADLGFELVAPAGAASDRWAVWVGPLGGEEVVVAEGQGAPPARLAWDQRGPDGEPLLEKGRVYAYRLEVTAEDGRVAGSPAGVFGVGAGAGVDPDLKAAVRGELFDAADQPTGLLQREVRRLSRALRKLDGVIVVEVHGDDALPEAEMAAKTQRRAEAAKALLAQVLEIAPERVEATGMGTRRPLVPNISDRNRSRNRRLEIRHRKPGEDQRPAALGVRAGYAPVARAGRDEAAADERGEFAMTAAVPEDGVVEVAIRAADGRRAVFPVRVHEGSAPARGEPRPVVVSGKLPGELTVGGAPAKARGLGVDVKGPAAARLAGARLAEGVGFTLESPMEATAWRLAVARPDGEVVFSASGDGVPPPQLTWSPGEGNDLVPGDYRYRLTVHTRDEALGQSPERRLRIGEPTGAGPPPAEPAPGPWGLGVNGRAVAPEGDGRVYAQLTVRGDEAVLVEMTRPDGGRAVFFVAPPAPPTTQPASAPAAAAATEPDGPQATPAEALGLRTYAPSAEAGAAPATQPAPPEHTPLPEDARAEMSRFGRDELWRVLAPRAGAANDADVPARQLSVELPPKGAELSSRTLPVRGRTAPENRVFLNGVEVGVDEDGRFGGEAVLAPGDTELTVAAEDPQGNRGVIRWPLKVKESAWFLLAIGEGLTGNTGAELDGVEPHSSTRVGDTLYLHGRAALYLKGYASGKEVLAGAFDHYEVTAHLDTARREEFEAYFEQLIDPETFYPVYGDSAQDVKDANTRGPLYVLVKADKSTLTVGNFKTGIRGIELLNYDRALYGAHVALDKDTGPLRHEVKAFVSDVEVPERHAYVELRGTGGSLYYLPHQDLIEGSERVYLVERDKITGVERRRLPLLRDGDYTVRYREGRVLMKTPVPSVTLDAFGPLPQPGNGEVLDGHPVYLSVEYDHRDVVDFGEIAAGAHVRETYDGKVSVGGGYIEEGRADRAVPDYKLWGAELGLRHGRQTRLDAEWAESRSANGENLYSEDGGLTFEPFNGRDGTRATGQSFLLRGGFELDDVAGEGDRDRWYTEGYWQYLAPGFYSGGTIQQQGLEKYGALTRFHLTDEHTLRLQHDGIVAEEPLTQGASFFHGFRRDVTRVGHTYSSGPLVLDTELVHTRADELPDEDPFETDVASVGAQYKLTPKWTLLAEQELVVRGDSRIHETTTDLLTTTAGARYQPTEEVSIEALETVRWSGDNATQIGMRTEVDDRHTVYVNERVADQDGTLSTSSVVGGEERWGEDKSGRSYGEYQLESGELGSRNRAVLGVGKRTKVVGNLTLDVAYERSQVFGESGGGEFSQDTVSLGSEWLDRNRVKVSGRYELRYEDNDEQVFRRDRLQFLTLNGLSWLLTRDLTMLLRGNYSHTMDLGFDATEAELVEASVGFAFRPVDYDWVAVLTKYTKRFEQRPIDVAIEEPVREESDVVALIPILELPWRFQLVEKLALKRMAVRVAGLPTVVSHSLLWINRLNYHLTNTWDVGAEYRFLSVTLAQNVMHGALFELNYIVQKKVRLGVGYNFTECSDDEFARLDERHGGPFFRVIANY